MNFIIDAQLPISLSEFLKSKGLSSVHTLELPKKNKTSDFEILKIALEKNAIIITKDLDFLDSFLLKQEPRKLILVKTGNISNKKLIEIFIKNLDDILAIISRSNLIEIGQSYIAEHQ
jgi:predicted nuclease of predicted toxin-antitoxin system